MCIVCYRTRLTLTLAERRDEGTYYCVSKNELGITRANIQVFGKFCSNRPPKHSPYNLQREIQTGRLRPSQLGSWSSNILETDLRNSSALRTFVPSVLPVQTVPTWDH